MRVSFSGGSTGNVLEIGMPKKKETQVPFRIMIFRSECPKKKEHEYRSGLWSWNPKTLKERNTSPVQNYDLQIRRPTSPLGEHHGDATKPWNATKTTDNRKLFRTNASTGERTEKQGAKGQRYRQDKWCGPWHWPEGRRPPPWRPPVRWRCLGKREWETTIIGTDR